MLIYNRFYYLIEILFYNKITKEIINELPKTLRRVFFSIGKLSRNTDNNSDSMELSIAIGSSICNENGKINTFKNFLENMIHIKNTIYLLLLFFYFTNNLNNTFLRK